MAIPNDPQGRTVADVKEIVIAETAATGNDEVSTEAFEEEQTDLGLLPAAVESDVDNDGSPNSVDEDDDNDEDRDDEDEDESLRDEMDDLRGQIADMRELMEEILDRLK